MKVIGKAIAVLLGISGFVATAGGIFFAYRCIVALFETLDSQVANVTGIACLVVFASTWVIVRGLRTAARGSTTAALREEKTAAYHLFVDFWKNRLLREEGRAERLLPEFSDKLQILDRLLALYGGKKVVEAHAALRERHRDKGAQQSEVRKLFVTALVAIREDLGTDTRSGSARGLEQLLLPVRHADYPVAESSEPGMRPVFASNA